MLYQQKDLQNSLKTTDTFIDKFLPFRMFKDNCEFLGKVLPEENAMKVKIMEKKKIKELYALLINDAELANFK